MALHTKTCDFGMSQAFTEAGACQESAYVYMHIKLKNDKCRQVHGVYVYMLCHVCMYACMHLCMYPCAHVRMCVCMHACMCMCVCAYVRMCGCVYACMCVCMYVSFMDLGFAQLTPRYRDPLICRCLKTPKHCASCDLAFQAIHVHVHLDGLDGWVRHTGGISSG